MSELRPLTGQIASSRWATQLGSFLEAATRALDATPFHELEEAARSDREHAASPVPPRVRKVSQAPVDPALAKDAGFPQSEALSLPQALIGPLEDFARSLREYAGGVSAYSRSLSSAPLMKLRESEDELIDALARFEVSRVLRQPLAHAQEAMLDRLIAGPMAPLLQELVAALTRFEWYFHDVRMDVSDGQIRLSGLATEEADIDIRLLLNAGERTIVMIAWFLALYILQPAPLRNVLVLDDPFSTLDENNRAALIATLRMLVRLTRPDQVVISTHERVVAEALTREFGAIEEWPDTVCRIECSRSADGVSIARCERIGAPIPDYDSEVARLGLAGGSPALA